MLCCPKFSHSTGRPPRYTDLRSDLERDEMPLEIPDLQIRLLRFSGLIVVTA